jgi:hypothetical protein
MNHVARRYLGEPRLKLQEYLIPTKKQDVLQSLLSAQEFQVRALQYHWLIEQRYGRPQYLHLEIHSEPALRLRTT